MDKKKLISAACTLAVAANLGMARPASAGFYFPSFDVSQQELLARKLVIKEFGVEDPPGDSAEAQRVKPILERLQKRLCDANGIEITTEKFSHVKDYKTKVHPIRMVDNLNNAYAMGAGYVYVGTEYVIDHTSKYFRPYDYMLCEKMLAHEFSHATQGHSLDYAHHYKSELRAEKGSIELMDKLPEGGWGSYLAALDHNLNRPKQNERMMKDFEEACGDKITISRGQAPTMVQYHSGNVRYPLKERDSSYHHDSNVYFGGQIAYCIAKEAYSLKNISLIENKWKDSLNFNGNYLLVCWSDKLPNNYRILCDGIFFGTEAEAEKLLDEAKRHVLTDTPLSFDNYQKMEQENLRKNSSYWKVWLACAVAADMDKCR